MKTITAFKCPECSGFLSSQPGQALDITDGITLECRNKDCGMADWAHGKNEKEAYEIFKQKCGVTGR
jgi:hypothetical protein